MVLLKLTWDKLPIFKRQFKEISQTKEHIRKGRIFSILLFSAILLIPGIANSQTNTWDGSTSTDWNTASNWSLNLVPTAAHDVVIPNSVPGSNDNPVISTAAVCNSLTMNGGNQPTTLSISGTNSLTVTNSISLSTGTTFNDIKLLSVGAGTLTCGSITMEAGSGFLRGTQVSLSTGTINVSGDITMGTGGFGSINDFTFTDAGTLNVGGDMSGGSFTASTGTVVYNGGSQTLGPYDYYNLTLSVSGTKSMTGISTIDGNFIMSGTASTTATSDLDINGAVTLGSGTSFTAGTHTHTVAGDWTNNGATFTGTGSTITLDGAAQTIGGSSTTTFNNLTLSGSGTKTFGLSTTMTGDLSIATGVVADLGTFTTHTANGLSLGGVGQTAGSWGSTSSAATNQNDTYFAATTGFITTASTGATTFYSRQSGNWNANTTWSTVTYGGAAATNFPTNGDIVNIGGGDFAITVNVNSSCGTLSFEANATNSPTVTINSGITLDVSGAVNIPQTGGFFSDTNTLDVGDGTLNAGSLSFNGGGFFGLSSFTINTGTATILGDITSDNIFTFVTFNGAGLLQAGGAFLNSSNAILTPGTGTIEYNGTVAQTVGDFTYNNLILSGSSTKDISGVSTVNGSLTMSGTASTTAASALTVGVDFTLGSGTTFTAGSYTHNIAGNWVNNGGTFNNTGSTINLNGTTQSIGGSGSTTFNNLTLAGSNTKTFDLSTTVNATLAINSGVVANLSTITTHTAKTLSLNGAGQTPGTWGSTASAATNQNDTYFDAAASGIVTVTNRIYYTRQTGDWNVNTTWSTVTYGNATNSGTFPTIGDIANIGGGVTITVTANAVCAFIEFRSANENNTVSINSGITLDVSDAVTLARASTSNRKNIVAVGAGILNASDITFTNGSTGAANQQGHVLTISTGTVTVSGDITEVGSTGSATITFSGSGLLQAGGAFLNSTNCTFTPSTGTVEYNGTTLAQTIGDLTYYDLTLNNISTTIPQLTLNGNTTATNLLTMTSGVVNMGGSTFILGVSGAASTLTRTASSTTNWMYGGTFLRYWVASTAVSSSSGNFYGLFPVGASSASSYRPVEINSTVSPTGTGSFSVTHTDATTTTDLIPVFDDGGTNIVRKHDAQFVTATTATGGTYDIDVTMTDLNTTGVLTDIRLAVSNGGTTVTTVGTHVAATGTVNNPTAGRTGVSLANLVGDFRITTSNSTNTPLPIDLAYFNAEVAEKAIAITWQTKSENNNDFFTIERSQNGEHFDELTNVKGAGNSDQELNYHILDQNPIDGVSYYRLKQTDFDGQYAYSQTVLVRFDREDSFIVYPNPITGNAFNLSIKGDVDQKVEVGIYDPFGKLVYTRVLTLQGNSSSIQINLPQRLRSGVYVITGSSNNKFYTKKLIVNSLR